MWPWGCMCVCLKQRPTCNSKGQTNRPQLVDTVLEMWPWGCMCVCVWNSNLHATARVRQTDLSRYMQCLKCDLKSVCVCVCETATYMWQPGSDKLTSVGTYSTWNVTLSLYVCVCETATYMWQPGSDKLTSVGTYSTWNVTLGLYVCVWNSNLHATARVRQTDLSWYMQCLKCDFKSVCVCVCVWNSDLHVTARVRQTDLN